MALTVEIVAPDRIVWSGAARFVTAPSVDGEIGMLPGHEPLLSLLKPGRLLVVAEGGARTAFTVESGFVSFDHDAVTVVAEGVAETSE